MYHTFVAAYVISITLLCMSSYTWSHYCVFLFIIMQRINIILIVSTAFGGTAPQTKIEYVLCNTCISNYQHFFFFLEKKYMHLIDSITRSLKTCNWISGQVVLVFYI